MLGPIIQLAAAQPRLGTWAQRRGHSGIAKVHSMYIFVPYPYWVGLPLEAQQGLRDIKSNDTCAVPTYLSTYFVPIDR